MDFSAKVSTAELADRWLALDKNPKTRKQIQDLVEQGDLKTLEGLLRKPLEFGTAGLRAKMEGGFSRMNCVTVILASQGLAEYVEKTVKNAHERGVVVGNDHRHNSADFGKLTAAVFLKRGFKVYYLEGISMTPLVPFTVKYKEAACGIMITASHNPKDDNGYKVYWDNGAQIIPPHDSGIAACIGKCKDIDTWDVELVNTHPNVINMKAELIDKYYEAMQSLVLDRKLNESTDLAYVYTAMHGVGAPFAARILKELGLKPYVEVAEQQAPNADFPTVVFPNPEEKGALDRAKEKADESGIGLVIANDPDADRFAAAEKQADGSWFVFSGDQLGILLASFALRLAKSHGIDPSKIAMVNSTVSSGMLGEMARIEGFHYRDTLTGFKWMSNELIKMRDENGLVPCFGYEEAIGYLMCPAVLDKDGVSALGCFVQLAAMLKEQGLTAKEYLDSLYIKYGYFASNNFYYICRDPQKIAKIFNKIRYGSDDAQDNSGRTNFHIASNGTTLRYPTQLGGSPVTYIRDLTDGFEVDNLCKLLSTDGGDSAQIVVSSDDKTYVPRFITSPDSQMITFKTAGNGRVTLRTSGTEPKIKCYLEMFGSGDNRDAVIENLNKLVECVDKELMEASKNGLA
ncbi:putative phosphoribomutase [Zancudomyces culisetae]|uniref:Putative phosphoribomutase n=1 Tax=Zancudomyces culisetae TaxID=1213189 RepID=A0A1R1PC36_ZANCU|nr:putative phosphoribomutase [Zancudomyces culisetae]|eukprot:OMH78489.1 putative phosphoribomutase [Zancudomyces culisetae]